MQACPSEKERVIGLETVKLIRFEPVTQYVLFGRPCLSLVQIFIGVIELLISYYRI
jgi:hypothetical protein